MLAEIDQLAPFDQPLYLASDVVEEVRIQVQPLADPLRLDRPVIRTMDEL